MVPPPVLYLLVAATFWAAPVSEEPSSTIQPITGNPVFDVLISYGPIGAVLVVVFILAITGRIEFKPSIERIEADKALLQDQVSKMIGTHELVTLPALNEAVRVMGEAAKATNAQNERLAALESAVAANTTQLQAVQVELARKRGGTP